MPISDADRWRFLADHKLTLHTSDDGWMVHWYQSQGPGMPAKFFPVSTGRTPEEAVDAAIERWRKKHKITE